VLIGAVRLLHKLCVPNEPTVTAKRWNDYAFDTWAACFAGLATSFQMPLNDTQNKKLAAVTGPRAASVSGGGGSVYKLTPNLAREPENR
jgi:hypothetical protein